MVYSNTSVSPPMGSGGKKCHYRKMQIGGGPNGVASITESRCYKMGVPRRNKYTFWFGGDGGDRTHCHS